MKGPFQILVFPFLKTEGGNIKYCIFKRKNLKTWQEIAGGGENEESLLVTAKRETFEEAGVNTKNKFIQLSSITSL